MILLIQGPKWPLSGRKGRHGKSFMWEGEKVLAVDGGDDCNTGVLSTTELWPEC